MNREFLERSLEDLDRELLAGDLTADDHRRLREQYERRLRGDAAPPAPPRRRRGLVVLAAGFVLLVAVAAGVLLARSAGRREAGDTITGGDDVAAPPEVVGTTLPPDLARCTTLSGGDAIDCFTSYTDANPDDPRGLTQFGLFAISQGMQSDTAELIDAGEGLLRRALDIDPDDVAARVYLAVVLDRTGRAEEAIAECARVGELDVPADLAPLVDLACT